MDYPNHTVPMHYFNHTIAVINLKIPPFEYIILITAFELITLPYHNSPANCSIIIPFQCVNVTIPFQCIIP
jgi:hypothetical protein